MQEYEKWESGRKWHFVSRVVLIGFVWKSKSLEFWKRIFLHLRPVACMKKKQTDRQTDRWAGVWCCWASHVSLAPCEFLLPFKSHMCCTMQISFLLLPVCVCVCETEWPLYCMPHIRGHCISFACVVGEYMCVIYIYILTYTVCVIACVFFDCCLCFVYCVFSWRLQHIYAKLASHTFTCPVFDQNVRILEGVLHISCIFIYFCVVDCYFLCVAQTDNINKTNTRV